MTEVAAGWCLTWSQHPQPPGDHWARTRIECETRFPDGSQYTFIREAIVGGGQRPEDIGTMLDYQIAKKMTEMRRDMYLEWRRKQGFPDKLDREARQNMDRFAEGRIEPIAHLEGADA